MLEFVGRILSIEPLIIEYPAGYKQGLEKLAQKDSLVFKIAPPRKLRTTGERALVCAIIEDVLEEIQYERVDRNIHGRHDIMAKNENGTLMRRPPNE